MPSLDNLLLGNVSLHSEASARTSNQLSHPTSIPCRVMACPPTFRAAPSFSWKAQRSAVTCPLSVSCQLRVFLLAACRSLHCPRTSPLRLQTKHLSLKSLVQASPSSSVCNDTSSKNPQPRFYMTFSVNFMQVPVRAGRRAWRPLLQSLWFLVLAPADSHFTSSQLPSFLRG